MEMKSRDDTGACGLSGAVTAAVIGGLDALLGLRGEGSSLTGGAVGMTLALSLALLVPFGVVLGGGVALARRRMPRLSLAATLRWIRRRTWAVALSVSMVLTLPALAIALGYRRGIQIDAIDFRPLGLALLATVMLAVGCSRRARKPKRARLAAAVATGIAVCASAAGLSVAGHIDGVVPVLRTRTVLIRPILIVARGLFDADDDGFPRHLCQADCDCDDGNPGRYPAAVDVPGNGVDEDCSGSDLMPAKALGLLPGVRSASVDRSGFTPPYNIVLVTIDTLRADRMHAYGYPRRTTPNLDRFADESVLFEQVRSQGPSTRFVFPVLLTGRYFSATRLEKGKKWYKLLPSNVTFAERLKSRGYRTMAVLPYFRFKEHSGFQQGFDLWEAKLSEDRDATWSPTGDLVTDRGIALLDTVKDRKGPWLLWLHYFDPHASYVKHPEQESFGTERADLYDGEILYVDRQVQRFFDALRARRLWDDAAIVVASDHGEGIGLETDHGFSYHGFSLFDSETRVPLMIKLPTAAPGRVPECVGVIDLAPTLLELGGVASSEDLQGTSLVPYLFGAALDRGPLLLQLPEQMEAVVDWPFKLIWETRGNRFSLFNLEHDPDEQTDLASTDLETVSRLKDLLQTLRFRISR